MKAATQSGQEKDSADQLGPVVAVAAAHQPHLMHGASQRRERAPRPW